MPLAALFLVVDSALLVVAARTILDGLRAGKWSEIGLGLFLALAVLLLAGVAMNGAAFGAMCY
jgi:hypothetical protein